MSLRWLPILFAGCATPAAPPAHPKSASTAPEALPSPPAAPPLSDAAAQAALTEQYELGKGLYVRKQCASCHGERGEGNPKNPPVIGPGALPATAPPGARLRANVTFSTAGDVLAFVRTRMPIAEPGTLTDAEAAAITSWMLSESKVDLTRPLDPTNAASIRLR